MHDIAILIGRFQPAHNGHMALLRQALAQAHQVVVVLGSAGQARSAKNPFTAEERTAMLRAALPAADSARLQTLAMRDYYDEHAWARAVQHGVTQLAGSQARICLLGHFKDSSSSYLRAFPAWELISLPSQGDIDASAIRDVFFGTPPARLSEALDSLADIMPSSSRQFLQDFARTAEYARLQEEWQVLRAYRASWASAPYAPVFVTVDALLRCQNKVLLIRRARAPGKDLWALPGGFLEPRDTLWQSCLRELNEETDLTLPEEQLRAALREVRVFDHPDRSQRGRTVTHVHHLDLGDAPLPTVRGGDDAAHAQWIALEQLTMMQNQFFEDHFHILQQCLRLTP